MIEINTELVKKLIAQQFPQWGELDVYPVEKSGNDNRTFHLGKEMTVRLPSAKAYVPQVEKELKWLPRLKPYLSLPISSPIAKGEPTLEYTFSWSVNKFIEGETVSYERILNMKKFATDLALFLKALQSIDIEGAPMAGEHNFYRGGDLSVYHHETVEALGTLKDILPTSQLGKVWEQSISSKWQSNPVWIHGDIAPGNLLVKNGILCGVIDFGIMGVGDPACDYAMAWTFLDKESRKVFFETLNCDNDTIDRARGWALWKALITYCDQNVEIANNAKFTIQSVIEELGL